MRVISGKGIGIGAIGKGRERRSGAAARTSGRPHQARAACPQKANLWLLRPLPMLLSSIGLTDNANSGSRGVRGSAAVGAHAGCDLQVGKCGRLRRAAGLLFDLNSINIRSHGDIRITSGFSSEKRPFPQSGKSIAGRRGDRGGSATPSGRPFTGSEWAYSASPAPELVRAGSARGGAPIGSCGIILFVLIDVRSCVL